ncbi:MAG TPA: hypothetical protein VEB22_00315, partial [Phycisphaerales bacterium]|nr:hypothetical protein [Phycisphaerales bacterium]
HGGDTRSFEYPHRMQMLLCDGKHFRAGKTRAKRVALFFLDGASRLGLHVVVWTAEDAPFFLRGLYETIRRYGLFDIAYLRLSTPDPHRTPDTGPGAARWGSRVGHRARTTGCRPMNPWRA